jgi:hypothetical protein
VVKFTLARASSQKRSGRKGPVELAEKTKAVCARPTAAQSVGSHGEGDGGKVETSGRAVCGMTADVGRSRRRMA